MKSWRLLALVLVALAALMLLAAACGDDDDEDGAGPAATEEDGATSAGGEAELDLTVENVQFDKDTLEAPAGAAVSLTLDNKDSVQHNFSLYENEDSDEPLFEGPLSQGPETITYEFTAPADAGTYHFHCDIHPSAMRGDFIVE